MARKRSNQGPVGKGLTRRVLVGVITLAAIAALVLGLRHLGEVARREIARNDRYSTPFSDVECNVPPGYERASFLSEVSYHSQFPSRFQSIDPDLVPKLSAAFAAHPWVASVEGVSIEPENRIRVALRFREPALAVRTVGAEPVRVVDTRGVLLPLRTDDANLPKLLTPVPAPQVPSGMPWPDETVKRAVELIDAHHPVTLEKTALGWRLTMKDGRVLAVE
jgi:hypothetical protein